MALRANTRTTVACLLVGLGALLVVAAIMVPFYTVGRLAKTPLDLEITTIATNAPNTPSEVMDAKSLTTGDGPVKIDTNAHLISQRYLTVEDPSGADSMTVQAGQTLRRIDVQGDTGLLTATIDRVTIDRKTGFPIDADDNGTIALQVNTKGQSVAETVRHTGLQYRFPIGTEKTSYPFFDINVRKSYDMKFVEETQINDLKVYHFRQEVPVTDLSKVANSATNKVAVDASKWGVEGDGLVTMNRFYGNTRDVWIEPQTGTIVKGQEQLNVFYARDAAKPEVTALKATLVMDDKTVNSQISTAKHFMDELSLYGRIIPIICGVLGLILLVAGVLLGMTHRPAVARDPLR
ncbi:DUF3068 domain-containing protein [Nocardia stercoris]|uniref:DUF3068 domain-containing protein n=1 Tax=Nocardia stercoris TaxID=2483361 RepID=A0A3M2LBH7_9NOCA|nr:DUF3068 domain-containing protein [Nocardia stercoris]RMI33953.1 DUF3068 domain-containing protein [Nocardia stercoris]